MITGFCNQCHKVWTLETRQGLCPWCGKLTTCQTSRAQALRSFKSKSNGRKGQALAQSNGYDQLFGDWHDWLEVARKYEGKVLPQDRQDIRHDIMLELHRATIRDGKPLPQLRAYKIASLVVALYWRRLIKREIKVCVYSGLPTEPHCPSCKHKPKERLCPYLALRPIESLEQDGDNEQRLLDTIADDKAIDIEAWMDARTWLLGCPVRLIEIASKKLDGIELTKQETRYLYNYRERKIKREQLSLL